MKGIVGLIAAMVLWCGSAAALDTDACHDPQKWWNPPGQVCIGLLEWDDLGEFDANDAFVWKEAVAAEIETWGTPVANWREIWAPYKDFTPNYTRLDVRHRLGKPTDTRFVFSGGQSIRSPFLWLVEGPDGEQSGHFFGYFKPPEKCTEDDPFMDHNLCLQHFSEYASDNCDLIADSSVGQFCDQYWDPANPAMNEDTNVAACCKLWTELEFYTIYTDSLSAADIESATWNGILVPPLADYFVDYKFLRYTMGPNEWQDTGWGEYSTQPEVYFSPFGSVVPEPGLNQVTVKLKNGHDFVLEFDVITTERMPVVPAGKYKKGKGKKKYCKGNKYLDKSVKEVKYKSRKKKSRYSNLIARELDGALVIQWAEPDGALTAPGMKLRVYVGDSWGLEHGQYDRDTFLFLDCPVQTGSVVVPDYIWQEFKEKMRSMGRTFVYVAGMYRYQSRHTMHPSQWKTDFHNRGYFEFIEYPIN